MFDDNHELYEKLNRLQWLLQRHHRQGQLEHGPMANPMRGQGRVISMLQLQSGISSKDLAYLLGIRQQSLNELINKLEKSGHVVRTPSPEDGRVMLVELTEKGKAEKPQKTGIGTALDCLDEDEQITFGEYLDRIIASLEEQLGEDPDESPYHWLQRNHPTMNEEELRQHIAAHRAHHGFGRHPFDTHGEPRHGRPEKNDK